MVSSVVKDVLGAVGGGILSFCLLPQLWKVWRTRSATDLSMPFLVLYNTGACVDKPLSVACAARRHTQRGRVRCQSSRGIVP